MNMLNQFIFTVLIYNLIIPNFVAAYQNENKYEDLNFNTKIDLLDLLQTYVARNKESRREAGDAFENWTGRWMPDRPGDPIPMPKVFPKGMQQNENQLNTSDWTGRWMPDRPGDPIPMPKVFPKDTSAKKNDIGTSDSSPRVQMGVNENCDDGKTNLTVDWNYSPVNYTCYHKKITPTYAIKPLVYCEQIPKAYVAPHRCMNQTIEYDDDIPVYGPHRPVWPVYGEYAFLPKQRWLHSMEHGAVVMLYHPCANPLEVKFLKTLVTGCLRRHVISPYNLLDKERPLALLTWGCRLTMSYVNPAVVHHFIRKRALHGAEQLSTDGNFQDGLLKKSQIVTDEDDTTLCPAI